MDLYSNSGKYTTSTRSTKRLFTIILNEHLSKFFITRDTVRLYCKVAAVRSDAHYMPNNHLFKDRLNFFCPWVEKNWAFFFFIAKKTSMHPAIFFLRWWIILYQAWPYNSVLTKRQPNLKLFYRFDGYPDKTKDFFMKCSSGRLHPIGWCSRNQKSLLPPAGSVVFCTQLCFVLSCVI